MSRIGFWTLCLGLLFVGTSCDSEPTPPPVSSAPSLSGGDSGSSAEPKEKITVKLETTKGNIVIELYPEWAPIGVKRVTDLVKIGFYDDVAFFRIVPDFIAQFGMNGNPNLNANWADNNLQDDPPKQSNRKGYVTFAKTGAPNSRSTQLFINFKDNDFLDTQGFAPIGKVIEGMDVAKKLNTEYGEAPQQDLITSKGNKYLRQEFPNLDYIVKATIVGPNNAEAEPMSETEKADDAKPAAEKTESADESNGK